MPSLKCQANIGKVRQASVSISIATAHVRLQFVRFLGGQCMDYCLVVTGEDSEPQRAFLSSINF